MLRTTLASVFLIVTAYVAAHWLTQDFQVWTAEGARRLDVARRPILAPAIAMDTLTRSDSTLAALLSDEGAVTIVDFVYTRCMTVCAALGGTFHQLQSDIATATPVAGAIPLRLLSISFDPEQDTVSVLSAYAARLGADPQIWRMARVSDPANLKALLQLYQVTVIVDGLGGYEHNAALLVVDAAGRLTRVFDTTQTEMALAFARSLAITSKR